MYSVQISLRVDQSSGPRDLDFYLTKTTFDSHLVFFLPSPSVTASQGLAMPNGEWTDNGSSSASPLSDIHTGLLTELSLSLVSSNEANCEARVLTLSSDEEDMTDIDNTSNTGNFASVSNDGDSDGDTSANGEVLSSHSSDVYYDSSYDAVIKDTVMRDELGFPFQTSSSPPASSPP